MPEKPSVDQAERRRETRRSLDRNVRIMFRGAELEGCSGNLSKSGVYFTAAGQVEVQVHVAGEAEPRRGRIVRVGEMRDGELGVAVKFLD